jgi:hypothetical protein
MRYVQILIGLVVLFTISVGSFMHFALGSTLASAPDSTGTVSVRIARDPGHLQLPPLDRTISDTSVAERLAADILKMPSFPAGVMYCPVDFGTSYTLAFTTKAPDTWTARVDVLGCHKVTLSNGHVSWAVGASQFMIDLKTALGLRSDELVPRPCPQPTNTRCYEQ